MIERKYVTSLVLYLMQSYYDNDNDNDNDNEKNIILVLVQCVNALFHM